MQEEKVVASGRLRLNLNPLNLVRWINSWPFDKTWKPGWIDSTWVNRFNDRAMDLEWIFIMTPSRVRKSFSKASPYFFVRTGPVSTGTDSIILRDFRRFSRTRFTRWIFCIFNRRRPVCMRPILCNIRNRASCQQERPSQYRWAKITKIKIYCSFTKFRCFENSVASDHRAFRWNVGVRGCSRDHSMCSSHLGVFFEKKHQPPKMPKIKLRQKIVKLQ